MALTPPGGPHCWSPAPPRIRRLLDSSSRRLDHASSPVCLPRRRRPHRPPRPPMARIKTRRLDHASLPAPFHPPQARCPPRPAPVSRRLPYSPSLLRSLKPPASGLLYVPRSPHHGRARALRPHPGRAPRVPRRECSSPRAALLLAPRCSSVPASASSPALAIRLAQSRRCSGRPRRRPSSPSRARCRTAPVGPNHRPRDPLYRVSGHLR